jgi:hypothetical protein
MNVISQMQGDKNWILPKRINRFFRDSHWLEIWENHLCPSMGPNGGSVARVRILDRAPSCHGANLRNNGAWER